MFSAALLLATSCEMAASDIAKARYDNTFFTTSEFSIGLSICQLIDSVSMETVDIPEFGTEYGNVSGCIFDRDGRSKYSGDTMNASYDMFRFPKLYIPEICHMESVPSGCYSVDLPPGTYTIIISYEYARPLLYRVTVRPKWRYVYNNYLGRTGIH